MTLALPLSRPFGARVRRSLSRQGISVLAIAGLAGLATGWAGALSAVAWPPLAGLVVGCAALGLARPRQAWPVGIFGGVGYMLAHQAAAGLGWPGPNTFGFLGAAGAVVPALAGAYIGQAAALMAARLRRAPLAGPLPVPPRVQGSLRWAFAVGWGASALWLGGCTFSVLGWFGPAAAFVAWSIPTLPLCVATGEVFGRPDRRVAWPAGSFLAVGWLSLLWWSVAAPYVPRSPAAFVLDAALTVAAGAALIAWQVARVLREVPGGRPRLAPASRMSRSGAWL